MDGGRPFPLRFNNKKVGLAETTIHPELAAHGFPVDMGFMFWFTEPLTVNDVVSVRFEDGRDISGSPTQSTSND